MEGDQKMEAEWDANSTFVSKYYFEQDWLSSREDVPAYGSGVWGRGVSWVSGVDDELGDVGRPHATVVV